jgi:hypothetical protein
VLVCFAAGSKCMVCWKQMYLLTWKQMYGVLVCFAAGGDQCWCVLLVLYAYEMMSSVDE